MIVDGARVRRGSKLAAGVILSGSIPVIDAETGEEVEPRRCPRGLPRGAGDPFPPLRRRRVRVAVRARSSSDLEGGKHDKLTFEDALRENGVSLG